MGDLKVYGLRKCTQYVKVLCKKKKLNKKMTEKVVSRTTVGGAAAAGGSECYAQGFLIFRRMLLLFHVFFLIQVTVYISFFQYLPITNCPNPQFPVLSPNNTYAKEISVKNISKHNFCEKRFTPTAFIF